MKSRGLGLIVRDAEDVLATCLTSVQGLFDEILVVDTGSFDGTREIVKKFDARLIEFDWIDKYRPNFDFGFAAARNFCWDNLHTDWKMWLDADDLLIGQENFDEMFEKLEAKPDLDGVLLEYLYSFSSEGEKLLAQIEPNLLDRSISYDRAYRSLRPLCNTTQFRERVVRADPSWRWQYPVHEALSVVGKRLARYDSMAVVHRRHLRPTAKSNTSRNWKLLSEIPVQERNERVWFYMGLERVQENVDESIDAFLHYLPLSTVEDERYFVLHYLANIYRVKNEYGTAREYDLRAVALRPTWRDAYAGLLSTCVVAEDWQQALYYGTKCATSEIPETPFAFNPFMEKIGWIVDYVKALAHYGRYEDALKECERGLELLPSDSGLLHNIDLFSSEINYRRGTDALADALEFLLRLDDGEAAAMLASRLHPQIRNHPRIAALLVPLDAACRTAANDEVAEEPVAADPQVELPNRAPEILGDQRMRYLREFFADHPRVGRVLQVGGPPSAAHGYADLGIEAVGVRSIPEACAEFDAVILWNALEKVKDPQSLVTHAKAAVRPGGHLIGFVPNGPATKGLAPPDQVPVRLRSYTTDTFRQVMGTVVMPKILPGWSAAAGHLVLNVPRHEKLTLVRRRTIAIVCPAAPEPWGPHSILSGIGGSEEAVIRLSRVFSRQGHRVTVYGTGWEGVDLVSAVRYRKLSHYIPHDILLGWRYPEIFLNQLRPLEATWKGLWLHDSTSKERVALAAPFVNAVWCISQYHASLYDGIPNVYVGRNGIDPWMFSVDVQRNVHKVVYVSTAFRGLDRLLNWWPNILAKVPDAELHAYYGWEAADKLGVTSTPQGAEFKRQVTATFEREPSLVWHGRVGQYELYKEMASAGVWAYPATWYEEHCISAYIAQGSGTWPVVTPKGALDQSVVFGWKTDDDNFVSSVVEALNTDSGRDRMADWIRANCSWDDVAYMWESLWRGIDL